jgi:heme/copper-type cytochrome/quinol oxidase subunit 2
MCLKNVSKYNTSLNNQHHWVPIIFIYVLYTYVLYTYVFLLMFYIVMFYNQGKKARHDKEPHECERNEATSPSLQQIVWPTYVSCWGTDAAAAMNEPDPLPPPPMAAIATPCLTIVPVRRQFHTAIPEPVSLGPPAAPQAPATAAVPPPQEDTVTSTVTHCYFKVCD